MADKGKNKGGFLKGLGAGLLVMSAPLFFKALAGQDKIEAARSINPARAAAMQDSANLSMILGVALLVGGLAAIIIGIAKGSGKPEGNGEAVPERIKVDVPSSWKSVVPTILAVLFGLALVAVIIRDNRIIKGKDAWNSSLNDQIYDKQETIDDLKDELEEAKTKMSDMQDNEKNLESALAKLPPLLITDLQMGVTNNERDIMVPHGNTIYSSETMFLSPSISYYGIRSEEVELHMKLFTPSGRMAYNVSESPSGFTNKTSFWTFKGENTRILNGWGKNVRGNWSAGSYRIEIWYGSTCLYSKDFEIF